jgi:hypothetical protein
MRATAILLTMLMLSACTGGLSPTGPAGQISSSNQNPETGTRGGSGAK